MRMDKSKFDIELPQCIINSYELHLASEIRKYYAVEGTGQPQNSIACHNEAEKISKRGNEVFNGRESILKSQNR